MECDSCNANITHSVHIRCAAEECRLTNIDLCPVCFCKGKEVGKHKANHPYRVIVSSLHWPCLAEAEYRTALTWISICRSRNATRTLSLPKIGALMSEHSLLTCFVSVNYGLAVIG